MAIIIIKNVDKVRGKWEHKTVIDLTTHNYFFSSLQLTLPSSLSAT